MKYICVEAETEAHKEYLRNLSRSKSKAREVFQRGSFKVRTLTAEMLAVWVRLLGCTHLQVTLQHLQWLKHRLSSVLQIRIPRGFFRTEIKKCWTHSFWKEFQNKPLTWREFIYWILATSILYPGYAAKWSEVSKVLTVEITIFDYINTLTMANFKKTSMNSINADLESQQKPAPAQHGISFFIAVIHATRPTGFWRHLILTEPLVQPLSSLAAKHPITTQRR